MEDFLTKSQDYPTNKGAIMGSCWRQDLRNWITSREIGNKQKNGTKDKLTCGLYGSIKQVRSWDPKEHPDNTHHGGIFNFDFATDG